MEINEEKNNNETQLTQNFLTVTEFPPKNSEDQFSNGILFFDSTSKMFSIVTKEEIFIYNKKLTKLKKKVSFKFPSESISKITITKELSFLSLLITPQNSSMIAMIRISTGDVVGLNKGNYKYLIDFFFSDERIFCALFTKKIVLYNIQMYSDEVKEIKKIKFGISTLLQNYSYCYQARLLCVLKTDSSFEIYDLNSVLLCKVHVQTINIPFYIKSIDTYLNDFDGGFFSVLLSATKKDKKKTAQTQLLKNLSNPTYLFSKQQFFLQNIYNKTYFVYLCYNNKTIFIYPINTFNDYDEKALIKIKYSNHNNASTLVFFDNLIVLLNFNKCIATLFDLELEKSDKVFLTVSLANSGIPKGVPSCSGNIMIFSKTNQKFYIDFNYELYLNSSDISTRHQYLLNIVRRKKAKGFFFLKLREMINNIENQYKQKNIFWVFDELKKNVSQKYELSGVLTQNEIYTDVFEKLLKEIKGSEKLEAVLRLLVYFYIRLKEEEIEITENFDEVFVSYLQRIDKQEIFDKICCNSAFKLPTSQKISNFLLTSKFKNIISKQEGFDMLLKLKEYEKLLRVFVEEKDPMNGIVFFKRVFKELSTSEKESFREFLEAQMKENMKLREMILGYVSKGREKSVCS